VEVRSRSGVPTHRSDAVPLALAADLASAETSHVNDRWASERNDSHTVAFEWRALALSLEAGSDAGLRCTGLDVEGALRGSAIYGVLGTISTAHIMKGGP